LANLTIKPILTFDFRSESVSAPTNRVDWCFAFEPSHPLLIEPQDVDHLPGEEHEWIEAAQRGDRKAYAKLVDHYWERLFRWLLNLTRDRHRAEDLAQETFMKALAALGSFRAGSNFRAWLFRIGHNNFVNLKRTEKRTRVPLLDDTAAPQVGTTEGIQDREALTAVAEALEKIGEDFRVALQLHVQEGMPYKEVAKVINTTEETARWRVFKARQKLLKLLPAELIPPDKS
jgi:RNA polymerase sigma-70 factor, ECF subfamily